MKSSRFSHPVCCAFASFGAAIALQCLTVAASAALILADTDARDDYPASAIIYTSALPNAEGDPADANSRGVRSTRIQAQTFRVASRFAVESIFLGYRWNDEPSIPTNFRLLRVSDVGTLYNPGTVPVVAGPVSVTIPFPEPAQINQYYAFRFDWDPSLSGGQDLILEPTAVNEGYAFEIVGTSSTSGPIAVVYRNDTNPFAPGRAIEQSLAGVATGFQQIDDLVLAITGRYIPEPSAITLAFVAIGLSAAVRHRRRAQQVSRSPCDVARRFGFCAESSRLT